MVDSRDWAVRRVSKVLCGALLVGGCSGRVLIEEGGEGLLDGWLSSSEGSSADAAFGDDDTPSAESGRGRDGTSAADDADDRDGTIIPRVDLGAPGSTSFVSTTQGRPTDVVTTDDVATSASTTGATATTDGGDTTTSTSDSGDFGTEGPIMPSPGVVLEFPDIEIPEPPHPDCGRLQWLPMRSSIAALSGEGHIAAGTIFPADEVQPNPATFRVYPMISQRSRAFVWSEGGEVVLQSEGSTAIDVSDDGAVVLSHRYDPNARGDIDLVVWYPDEDREVLVREDAIGTAIGGDGELVIGNVLLDEPPDYDSGVPRFHAFRAELGASIESAPFWRLLEDGEPFRAWYATDASATAAVIVGTSMLQERCGGRWCSGRYIFLWGEAGFEGPIEMSLSSMQISRDGRIVVGRRPYTAGYLRWRVETNDVEELYVDDSSSSSSVAISEDGSTILFGNVVWQEGREDRDLRDLLADSCIDTELLVPSATWFGVAVSLEHRTIVGCTRVAEEICWIASNLAL